jgi:hypothetical protein
MARPLFAHDGLAYMDVDQRREQDAEALLLFV